MTALLTIGLSSLDKMTQDDRDELFAGLQAARMFCLDAWSDARRIGEDDDYRPAWNERRMAIEEWLACAQCDLDQASTGRYLDPAGRDTVERRGREIIAAYARRHPPITPEPARKSWGLGWLGGGR
ncbi:MAG: hypothetical protein NUW01_01660 [Gemmatimonadaceae bacterium]|nr:hypothetical protein [Gemmatimonadaceae bacterium]